MLCLSGEKTGVKLTGAGQQLYPYIQKIIAGNNNLRQAIENLNGLSSGAVKLGCINTVCLTWIPRILPVFHEDYRRLISTFTRAPTRIISTGSETAALTLESSPRPRRKGFPFSPSTRTI